MLLSKMSLLFVNCVPRLVAMLPASLFTTSYRTGALAMLR